MKPDATQGGKVRRLFPVVLPFICICAGLLVGLAVTKAGVDAFPACPTTSVVVVWNYDGSRTRYECPTRNIGREYWAESDCKVERIP